MCGGCGYGPTSAAARGEGCKRAGRGQRRSVVPPRLDRGFDSSETQGPKRKNPLEVTNPTAGSRLDGWNQSGRRGRREKPEKSAVFIPLLVDCARVARA